jgi:aminopeptidase N
LPFLILFLNPTDYPIRSMHRLLLVLTILVALVSTASAQSLFESLNYRDGARSHRFDVLHIAINIRFDTASRSLGGSVRHRMRSLDPALTKVRLDAAANIDLQQVSVDGAKAGYTRSGDTLDINLPKAQRYGDTFTVEITYHVVPQKGFYFIVPDSLVPTRRSQVWTQGEANDNHYWVPIYDYPNDRATSEVWVSVPTFWKALSNGKLVDLSQGSDGAYIYHYLEDKPHSSYLIMIAAGDYLVTRDTVGHTPLEYWTYREYPERVRTTFGRTPDVIKFYEGLTGIPYPWNKYAQIFIADFMYGGMENTTATTLNDYALVDQRGFIDYNPDGLVAHEAAHMWYGDLVTNRSWGHLWLHESFATYLASRYKLHKYGEDAYAKEIYDAGQSANQSDQMQGRSPIANGSGITADIYDRGSRVLHMLNRIVGEAEFWRANKLYLERNAYNLAETNDLKIAFEDATGLNLDWFFDEWIYKAGMPMYRVDRSYAGDTLKLRVRQTQPRDSLTGLFQMPVPIEFYVHGNVIADTIWVSREDETFSFPLHEKPRYMIFDAGDAIMKTLDFPRPEEELTAQLDAPRMIDRLLAVKELAVADSMKVKTTVHRRSLALRDAYMREYSPFVRQEIVEHTSVMEAGPAVEILTRALRDSAADVRRASIENFYMVADKKRRAELLRPMLEDSSYNVISAALGMLAVTDTTGMESKLRAMKGLRGRRDQFANAWLSAVAAGNYNSLIDDVADYTLPLYRNETRVQAYFALSKLQATTPAVRMSIERGLRTGTSSISMSAAAAARKHLDPEMRATLERLRDMLTGDRKDVVEKLLKK